jgi:hypothetical protein
MKSTLKKYLSIATIVFCLGTVLTACSDKTSEVKVDAKTESTPTDSSDKTATEKVGEKDDSTANNTQKNDKNDTGNMDRDENKKKQIKEIEKQKLGVLPTNETDCPKNAPIKGKIAKERGRIYHLSGTNNYDRVKPDVCFSTKENAEKAGFKTGKTDSLN